MSQKKLAVDVTARLREKRSCLTFKHATSRYCDLNLLIFFFSRTIGKAGQKLGAKLNGCPYSLFNCPEL
jgi:hypothetical protein